MLKSFKEISNERTVEFVTVIIIVIIALVGLSALLNGTSEEDRFQSIPTAGTFDYYHCPHCNTITPCPLNYNRDRISYQACPSCGLRMNCIQRRLSTIAGVPGSNLDVAGGFGRSLGGGQGFGPGGYLICPDCGYIMPHQRGVACYTVQCPKCNSTMARQLPAGIPGSNLDVVGGSGRGLGGGQGFGPGGYLICPDCGYIMPHQRGVACYTVQCPKCNSTMARQLPAGIPTAFYSNNRNNNQSFQENKTTAALPITSNAKMPHKYRGVCSKCHIILDR